MNNPALAMLGLFIIGGACTNRAFALASEAVEMTGVSVFPIHLAHPSKVPKEDSD